MPIQDAINFLTHAGTDVELRDCLIPLKSNEILPTLAQRGYSFTMDELEDSINMLHVKCQTQEDADHLFELVNWFKIVCL